MGKLCVNREIFFSIKDFKESRSTLGEFLADFLNWSDDNVDWFTDNHILAINYYFNKVELAPLPCLLSFKVMMNHILDGKIVATYDVENNKIKNQYRYYETGDFGMKIAGSWAVLTPDKFFELNKEVFIVPKEEK